MELYSFLSLFVLLSFNPSFTVAENSSEIVTISQGQLQGKILNSQSGRPYSAFLNIPYAEAGRFQAPSVASKWKGIMVATEDGPECAYVTWFTHKRKGVEDCLTLNVYTPASLAGPPSESSVTETSDTNNETTTGSTPGKISELPVLVYFHGGVFALSSRGSFLDSYMMDEDVVFVSIKYRVGPFGFLSTGDKVIPGNFGLKDQNMALQWIQTNIQQFGGTTKNVVIIGNGAGAVSANLHMLSKKSTGLFHGAILHSGSALVPWGITNKPLYGAGKLAKALKCPSKNSGGLLACLLKKTTTEILDGMKKIMTKGPHPFAPFAPVVEPDFPGAFISENPYVSLRNGSGIQNNVPVLIGVTENEDIFKRVAYIASHPEVLSQVNHGWKKLFPVLFEYNSYYTNFSKPVINYISKSVRKYYFNGKNIDENNQESLRRALADRIINYGMKKAIVLLTGHVPVYAFLLDSSQADSFENHRKVDAAMDGAPNIVSNSLKVVTDYHQRNTADILLKHIITLIASFAREKKPTALWGSEKTWEQVSSTKTIKYYRIGDDTALVTEPFTDGVDFWTTTLHNAMKKQHKINKKHRRH